MNQGAYFSIILFLSFHRPVLKPVLKGIMGIKKTRHFNCWRQYLCMLFGQLTHRESLSYTILCLKANAKKLYHLGIGEAIAKSTLSSASEKRDWRVFPDFAWININEAKQLYADEKILNFRLTILFCN